ncbi:MAG: hypothetical protein IPL32_09265 [Chloracidobacterium sp.]|nr:hypothetical protein [Chloracidobacterium sp.]
MKVLIATTLLSLILSIPAFSQKIEDGWKGLLPFKSTRADFEKIFGKGTRDELGEFEMVLPQRYVYRTDETLIRVTYSEKQCDARDVFYRMNVPDGTVLRYSVSFKHPKPLSGFTFDSDRLVRCPNAGTYYCYYQTPEKTDVFPPSKAKAENVFPNETAMRYGIWFEGEIITNRDFVRALYYVMPWGERERHPCKLQNH